MTPSGIIQDPIIANWLGGVEPAWTSLDEASLTAPRNPPSPIFGPIRLGADLTADEIQQSPMTRNALILLRMAATGPGLKMTATGNLSRAVVCEMTRCLEWPDFDLDAVFAVREVVNEPDFFPLFFLRHIPEAARSIRRYKGHFRTTQAGRKMMHESNMRMPRAARSLSVAAHDRQTSEQLTRLCTIPTRDLFDDRRDATAFAMPGQILDPLVRFGRMEERDAESATRRIVPETLYRKTALFDRFLSFDVQPATSHASRH